MSGVGVEHLPCRYTRLPDLTTCTAVFASHHVVMLHLILYDELEQIIDSLRSALCGSSLRFASLPLRAGRSTRDLPLRCQRDDAKFTAEPPGGDRHDGGEGGVSQFHLT